MHAFVIITGGSSGIGKATALAFAARSKQVVCLDILPPENPADFPSNVQFVSCDMGNYADIQSVFTSVLAQYGAPDVLVANAGILGPRRALEKYEVADFEQVLSVNVTGVWACLQAVIPAMKEKKKGAIVVTASVAGHVGMAGHIAYSASKHAVVGMTKTAALELARVGIRVNAVCPGFTETHMLAQAEVDEAYRQGLIQATPQKRFGQPSEIADAILYLASDQSTFMTGQSMILDGGLSIQ